MEPRKLYRVRQGRKLCGVCLGVAEYLSVDVTVVRLVWLIAALAGLWAYIICAVVLPDKPY